MPVPCPVWCHQYETGMCWDRDRVVEVTKSGAAGTGGETRRGGVGQPQEEKVPWDYTRLYTSRDSEKNPPFLSGAQTKPQQIPLKHFV